MDDDLISISKCAKLIGIHKSTLASQVASGAVRSHGGKLVYTEVLEDRAKNIDLSRSNRHSGQIDGVEISGGPAETDPPKAVDPPLFDPSNTQCPTHDPTTATPPGNEDEVEAVVVDGKLLSYRAARALKETYLARLAQLQFERENGQVVAIEAVGQVAEAENRIVRDQFLAWPAKFAGALVGKTEAEIRVILRGEVIQLLTELSDVATPAAAAAFVKKAGKRDR